MIEAQDRGQRGGLAQGYLDDDRLLLSVQHPDNSELESGLITHIVNELQQRLRRELEAGNGHATPVLREVELVPILSPISIADPKTSSYFSVLAIDLILPNRQQQGRGAAVPIINLLNRMLAREELVIEGVMILTANPDWIGGITGDVIIKGGPGTGPRPARNVAIENALYSGYDNIFADCDQRQHHGEGVTVAILDTAPTVETLTAVLATKDRACDLLRQLDPQLTIHNLDQHAPHEGHRLEDYNYPMSDHGLFVAGIVHSIAPQAKIHLIRVLNDYGVGNLAALLDGLRLAQELGANMPLVINCSLTLNVPPGQATNLTNIQVPHGHSLLEKLQGRQACALVVDSVFPLASICELLAPNEDSPAKIVIVGAAGNDSLPLNRGNHRQAGYPAALDTVVGVGAIGVDGEPLKFSNNSDSNLSAQKIEQAGLATFGGDDASSGKPVLGIYTAEYFPDFGGPNANGWAYWSGTSFAAPIISGIAALGLACGLPPNDVLSQIFKAAQPPTIPGLDTVIGDTLDIYQG